MTFIVKDSGKREQFSGGMQRDTAEGKIEYDRIYDGPMYDRWAEHLTKGGVKYPDVSPGVANWTLAEGIKELVRAKKSAARHFRQWMRGDVDEDHAAATYFNINLAEYVKGKLASENDAREHARNTQQRFLSGLDAETGDFEYDEARRIEKEQFPFTTAGGLLAVPETTIDIAEWANGIVDQDKCGTTDGVTPIPTHYDPTFGFDMRPDHVIHADSKALSAYAEKAEKVFGSDLLYGDSQEEIEGGDYQDETPEPAPLPFTWAAFVAWVKGMFACGACSGQPGNP